jgi:1,4-dihydroxy-2-naphthoate polyprenyltransferase
MTTAPSPTLSPARAWLMAIRPRTLPAAVSPVLIGTALAIHDGAFALLPALAALAGSLLLQIGVNLANDYFDHARGVDGPARRGPVRVTQSGLISPQRVRLGMILVFLLAALIGVYLIVVGGWPILVIGLASILSALAYSGGPFPLASHGLGDLFVYLFFGLAAVSGTYIAQAHSLPLGVIIATIPPGFLITNILVVNNTRDIETDRAAGKHTLAVLLGERGSRAEYVILLVISYLVPVAMWIAGQWAVWGLLSILSLPLAVQAVRGLYRAADGPSFNRLLAGTARLALVFSVLLSIGLAIR